LKRNSLFNASALKGKRDAKKRRRGGGDHGVHEYKQRPTQGPPSGTIS